MSAEPMIQCENQTRRFGLFTAADHVSFSAAKASVFGCLGPNGSGESTVIRWLCGLREPSKGGFADGINSLQVVRVRVQTEDRVPCWADAGLGPWVI
jgi:ABC-2 type transport system ATP-binding protein